MEQKKIFVKNKIKLFLSKVKIYSSYYTSMINVIYYRTEAHSGTSDHQNGINYVVEITV